MGPLGLAPDFDIICVGFLVADSNRSDGIERILKEKSLVWSLWIIVTKHSKLSLNHSIRLPGPVAELVKDPGTYVAVPFIAQTANFAKVEPDDLTAAFHQQFN